MAAKNKEERTADGLPIRTEASVTQAFAREIGKSLGVQKVFSVELDNGDVGFAATGLPLVRAEGFPVMEMMQSANYWVSCSVRYARENSSALLQIASIRLFGGTATDVEKLLLLRSEWDLRRERTQHGQPHWHVHLAECATKVNQDFLDTIREDGFLEYLTPAVTTFEEFSFSAAVTRFHLAMATRWHEQLQNVCPQPSDHSAVVAWMGGCLRYITGQIAYLIDKGPGRFGRFSS